MDKSEIKKEIGERLRALRQARSQDGYAKFAIQNDITPSTLWKAETGREIQLDILLDLLKLYDIPLEEFFKGL